MENSMARFNVKFVHGGATINIGNRLVSSLSNALTFLFLVVFLLGCTYIHLYFAAS